MDNDKPFNPFIVNFCEALIRKRGLELSEEAREKEVNKMYEMIQNIIGRKLVENLPQEKKSAYLACAKDLSQLSLDKIGEIFGDGVPDAEVAMKEALVEFSEIYLRNR